MLASALAGFAAHGVEGLDIYSNEETEARRVQLLSLVDSFNITTFPEPKGLQFGKLKINPYMTFDEVHTDNSRRTRAHALSDDLFSYDAGFLSAFRPMECVRTTLNYDFGWHDYLQGTLRDYLSQQANCEVVVDRVGVEGMSLAFSDLYRLTGNSSALENEIVQFQKYQYNHTEMRAQYKLNRIRITGTYGYNFLDYAAKDFSLNDFRSQSGQLEFAWQWLPNRVEIFTSAQILRTLFDHDRQSDFDTDTFLSGVRGRYSKLTYSLGVGYVFSRPIFADGVKGDIGFNGFISYSPHSRLTFDATASRGFVAGVRTGSTLETDASANFKVLLTRRGTFVLSYIRNESDRLNGVHQTSVAYSPRFEYKLNRRAIVSASYSRYDRSSNFSINEFSINELKVNVRLSW